jgi:hypothetical protein
MAEPQCSQTVIFTTPGVTWRDVALFHPAALLSLAKQGAIGSMSVHTDASRPSYSSAFMTLGAGARMPGFEPARANIPSRSATGMARDVAVASRTQLSDVSRRSGYGARAGALAGALKTPVFAIGDAAISTAPSAPFAQWPLLTAIEPSGRVAYAATAATLTQRGAEVRADRTALVHVVRGALALGCATLVIDPGDLERAEMARDPSQALPGALARTDQVLARVSRLLDPRRDLLLIVTPTSPPDVTHLGIAIAVGPGFTPGTVLESASTRRPGIVTLPDVAPTVLTHFGVDPPAVMSGQPFFSADGGPDRVAAAVRLDNDAVFIDGTKAPVAKLFLVFQVAFFAVALTVLFLRNRHREAVRPLAGFVAPAAVAVAGLPVATYLVNLIPAARGGRADFIGFCLLVVACVVAVNALLGLPPLEKLGVVAAFSLAVIVVDLVSGGHLQLNSVLGDSPLIAGRFAGAGNNAFAIMASTAVVIATLAVWRRGRTRVVLAGVAVLFIAVVVVDGAPQLGSDVGGVLALVPGFALTWILLAGKGISWKVVTLGLVAAVAASGLFIAIDVARPPEQRTHLGRFFEDVRSRGGSAFVETVERKAASNLAQVRSLQNLYKFLLPAIVTAIFLFWPGRWWKWFGLHQPLLRAGLVGGLAVAVLGSALNDSGITIFTTMLLFLTPMAILIRLRLPEPPLEARP